MVLWILWPLGPSVPDFGPPPALTTPSHLILVPCHGVYTSPTASRGEARRDTSWALDPFQKGIGTGTMILEHIETAFRALNRDGSAVLVFSGGQTKQGAGPMTEAQSYWFLSQHLGLHKHVDLSRVITEEFARDSFENLVFSICRFYQVTGGYPHSISVIGMPMKEARFVDLHRAAIGFPADRFHYTGVPDPSFWSAEQYDAMQQGEHDNAYSHFTIDPLGCSSTRLLDKRRHRNPFAQFHGYLSSCPALHPILTCSPSLTAVAWSSKVPL